MARLQFIVVLVLSLSLRAGAQWRAHPPSAMDASGQMRVEDRDSRSDVEENELNAIFLQACKHSLVIGEICPASSGAECPDGFPTLEKHTASNHGDVCRSGKDGPIGVGWYCVPGCFGRSSAPWCVQSGTENDPCRAN